MRTNLLKSTWSLRMIIIVLILTPILSRANMPSNEEMTYTLRYGIIQGGKVQIRTGDSLYLLKPAVYQYLRMKTVGLADVIYKVDDIYESFMDPKTMKPLKSVRNIKERKYRYYNEVIFDQQSDSIQSQRSGKKVVPKDMVDLLGLLFYIRQSDFLERIKKEQRVDIPVVHDDELMKMYVNFLGMKTIRTSMGMVQCFVLSPVIDKGRILKKDDGLRVYITNDQRRLPVLMELDMLVGAVKCELKRYVENGKVIANDEN